jgi:hypothetical protein
VVRGSNLAVGSTTMETLPIGVIDREAKLVCLAV